MAPLLIPKFRLLDSIGLPNRQLSFHGRVETVDDAASDASSLFSEPEWNLYNNKKESSTKLHHLDEEDRVRSIRKRWKDLKRRFRKREELMRRFTRSKSYSFHRQLTERERIVYKRTVERLISKCSGETDETLRRELEREIIGMETTIAATNQEATIVSNRNNMNNNNRFVHMMDVWTFELNSSIPAACSLLIYILTETGIEEGVGSMMDRLLSRPWMTHLFPQHVSSSLWWWWIQNTIVLLVGLLLMRWTGDLFWWARDPIYDMVKWEYHNRQRLGYRDAKWMAKVREKDAVRAMIFLVGIYLACDASAKFFEASWEQQWMDMDWTWSILTLDSYERYWTEWSHASENDDDNDDNFGNSLHSIQHHILFHLGFVVMGITVLRISGLRMEDKY
jgi:hypothetical protein